MIGVQCGSIILPHRSRNLTNGQMLDEEEAATKRRCKTKEQSAMKRPPEERKGERERERDSIF